MCIKVLKLRKREVVINLASSRNSYYLITRQISVLRRDKDLTYKDKKRWDNTPRRSDALY